MFNEFKNKFLMYLGLFFLGIPFVSAFTNPAEQVFVNIASFFNFEVFAHDPRLQVGLLRFLLWIMLFSILFWSGTKFAFKGDDGRKTAGVVAAIMSLISVIFMPENAIIGIGVTYATVIFAILVVGIAALAIYLAFAKLKGEWYLDLFGVLILLLATSILNVVFVIMALV
jgi:hypothetical protein